MDVRFRADIQLQNQRRLFKPNSSVASLDDAMPFQIRGF